MIAILLTLKGTPHRARNRLCSASYIDKNSSSKQLESRNHKHLISSLILRLKL